MIWTSRHALNGRLNILQAILFVLDCMRSSLIKLKFNGSEVCLLKSFTDHKSQIKARLINSRPFLECQFSIFSYIYNNWWYLWLHRDNRQIWTNLSCGTSHIDPLHSSYVTDIQWCTGSTIILPPIIITWVRQKFRFFFFFSTMYASSKWFSLILIWSNKFTQAWQLNSYFLESKFFFNTL